MNTVCYLGHEIQSGMNEIFFGYYINVIDREGKTVYSNYEILSEDDLKIELFDARNHILELEHKKPA